MLSCEAIPDPVPGLSPSGRADGRSLSAVRRTGVVGRTGSAVRRTGIVVGRAGSAVRRTESLGTLGFPTGRRHTRERLALRSRRQHDRFAPGAYGRRRAGHPDTRNAQPALGIAGYAPAGPSTRAGARPLRGGGAR